MQTAHRCMGIPCTFCPVAGKNIGKTSSIFCQMFQANRAILNKGNRLGRIFHAHHNIQAGFTHFCHTPLQTCINRLDNPACPFLILVPAKTQLCHHPMQFFQTAQIFIHILFGKFHHQQGGRLAAHHLLDNWLENSDRTRQLQHRVINKLYRDRIQFDQMLGSIHRLVKGRKMANAHDFLCRQWPEL